MQLRPSTARQYGADARVPEQNIDAGTRYLRFLIERYRHSSSPLKDVIAAYNAGVGQWITIMEFRLSRNPGVRESCVGTHAAISELIGRKPCSLITFSKSRREYPNIGEALF
jgi:hypothetical protein